jgi:hypothetical protein
MAQHLGKSDSFCHLAAPNPAPPEVEKFLGGLPPEMTQFYGLASVGRHGGYGKCIKSKKIKSKS